MAPRTSLDISSYLNICTVLVLVINYFCYIKNEAMPILTSYHAASCDVTQTMLLLHSVNQIKNNDVKVEFYFVDCPVSSLPRNASH